MATHSSILAWDGLQAHGVAKSWTGLSTQTHCGQKEQLQHRSLIFGRLHPFCPVPGPFKLCESYSRSPCPAVCHVAACPTTMDVATAADIENKYAKLLMIVAYVFVFVIISELNEFTNMRIHNWAIL